MGVCTLACGVVRTAQVRTAALQGSGQAPLVQGDTPTWLQTLLTALTPGHPSGTHKSS